MRTILLALLADFAVELSPVGAFAGDRIRPDGDHPRYWAFEGQPVLLLGASDDDNLFQWPAEQLDPHLDAMVAAGANVIRNTMSDRDEGNARAFLEIEPGTYDLARWNPVYWNRFEHLLQATRDRGIFVQIEVWDRFDHSREQWTTDPYHPRRNVNYTREESGFNAAYPQHPGANDQPFFFTVPALDDNEVVRQYQEAFVDKLLSHSLKYGHVLYCIDNETSGQEAWSSYWAAFLRTRSEDAGLPIMITEMWDPWDVTSDTHQRTVSHPGRYDFIDLSQNTWHVGESNWRNAQVIYRQIVDRPRPINNTKIYGSEVLAERSRGMNTHNAMSNFWRNLLGGFASSRFHRPESGQGLSEAAQVQLRTARAWLGQYDVFRSVPDSDWALLDDRSQNEACAAAISGEAWTVFFPGQGSVLLKVDTAGPQTVRWADLSTGAWTETAAAPVEERGVRLNTPGEGMWLALVRTRAPSGASAD